MIQIVYDEWQALAAILCLNTLSLVIGMIIGYRSREK